MWKGVKVHRDNENYKHLQLEECEMNDAQLRDWLNGRILQMQVLTMDNDQIEFMVSGHVVNRMVTTISLFEGRIFDRIFIPRARLADVERMVATRKEGMNIRMDYLLVKDWDYV